MVKTRVAGILARLGLRDRVRAVVLARETDLISPAAGPGPAYPRSGALFHSGAPLSCRPPVKGQGLGAPAQPQTGRNRKPGPGDVRIDP